MALMLMVGAGFAQTKPVAKKATVTTVETKKDGTPDKRYKVNKQKITKTVVLKKDGTPDKRYKTKVKKPG